ncbi:MAG: type II toxin-antitoxin system VapC family toxin, partial [Candidatus Symbiothrix sp.]|nr:type II toxin-antitoxin system VapC family toxin [Candidatus Symbiothrix sp.]
REDIEYFQHPYYISVETLREIVILQSLKKIKFDYSLDKIVDYLNEVQIKILPIEVDHIRALEKLPISKIDTKMHEDPFDRMLIAQSIAEKFTIVSSDGKFPPYRNYGLKLLVNEK